MCCIVIPRHRMVADQEQASRAGRQRRGAEQGARASTGVGGKAYHVDSSRGGVGKSAHPIMCQGKGRFDTVGGCSPSVLQSSL